MSLVYTYVDVKEEIVNILKQKLAEEGFNNIRVLKSDPKDAVEIPCVGINRAGDDEQNQVLGEDCGTEYDETLKKYVHYKGTFFNETMEIRVWHTNADERDKLYILVKIILFDLKASLAEKGLINMVIRGGRDEQENNFPPHPLYWSAINLNYLNPMDIHVVYDENIGIIAGVNTYLEGQEREV